MTPVRWEKGLPKPQQAQAAPAGGRVGGRERAKRERDGERVDLIDLSVSGSTLLSVGVGGRGALLSGMHVCFHACIHAWSRPCEYLPARSAHVLQWLLPAACRPTMHWSTKCRQPTTPAWSWCAT